jgi:2-polyprenyl-6-methoxyphenol hydroxylase-like FAD-dependent oxidoreductase
MSDVVISGGGMGGLTNAMLLARDGHQVTVLERDPAPPIDEPDRAWEAWERRGVNQFRMLHFLLPRWRELIEQELPEVAAELDARGALRYNFVASAPDELKGGVQPGDDRFETLTARRPVIEGAVATVAESTPGVTIRRGVAVEALLAGAESAPGVPHVVGVRTDDGEELRADLVVDASGRRSALPRLLEAIGARAPHEELEDCGFVYYGRHFRSPDGSLPPAIGPLLQHYGTISILTLPADNGTWGIGVIASANDTAMRGLKDPLKWEAVVSSHPLVAHWLDGEPLSDDVAVMAKIEDRYRRYAVDGQPVATGVVAVGDAWACTNPSLGRGITIGLYHALVLRDLLRRQTPDDAMAFATAFDQVTTEQVEPWYRTTLWYDRHRLGEIEALLAGSTYEPDDPAWDLIKGLDVALTQDGELLRSFGELVSLISRADDVFSRPGVAEKIQTLGGGWRDVPTMGPAREDLVATVQG